MVLLAVARGAPLELRLILTRLVFAGRIYGLSCLLVSSLCAAGLKVANLRFLVGVPLVLALVLAGLLPLDATRLGPDYLYRLGDPHGFRFVEAAVAVLVVLDFAAAGLVRGDRRFLGVTLAAAALAAGRALFQYGPAPVWPAAGVVLILAGGVAFIRWSSQIYLWY